MVTLHAAVQRQGSVRGFWQPGARERAPGCYRLWLITTNDNEPAIRFYDAKGMTLVAIHHNAIQESAQT